MDLIKSLLILSIPLLTLRLVKHFHRQLPLPPGPKGLPILGNFFNLKTEKRNVPIWVTYSKWSQTYGDISSFHVFGTRTVILNSYKAIVELLEHRSYNYSDRIRWPMLGELMRFRWMIPVMEYSDRWRMHRRVFHQFFQPRMVPEYYNIQRERSTWLVQKLATAPKDFFKHVRKHSGGAILEAVYGYHIQENNDPYIKLFDGSIEGSKEAGIFGSFWVDYFPALKYIPAWFPGGGFKVKAESWARDAEGLRDDPWTYLKQCMVWRLSQSSISCLVANASFDRSMEQLSLASPREA
ncbi:cytochrome P450 [Marasmius fiardii PR-910]|nr:cytochrome P450 [Marasmius fiardii PR-910]